MSPPLNSLRERIETLIASDQLEAALTGFRGRVADTDSDLGQELILHQAALARAAKDLRRGLITASQDEQTRNRVRYAVLELLREWSEAAPAAGGQQPGPAQDPPAAPAGEGAARPVPTVFISYSRTDLDVARRIKTALEAAGIRVRIDDQDIRAGEDIESFIHRVIAETDVVLSIVSGTSLLSPWVGLEGVHTLYEEALHGGRKLIACYLDDGFLDLGFRLTATDQIDARIAEIDRLCSAYAERHIDTSDLNRQKARLFELRNNLGKILDRLRGSLCLDIREPTWSENLPRIIAAIKDNEE